MTYLAILAMMLMAFAVVGWPLIGSSRARSRDSEEGSPFDDLLRERDAAYVGIQELEFEHELGNLSEPDYQNLRQRYRSDAADTLRKLDAAVKVEGDGPAGALPTPTADAPPESPQAGSHCPSCGKPTEAADQYCWGCGAQLGRRCPSCAESTQEGDRFCARCGAPLEAEA